MTGGEARCGSGVRKELDKRHVRLRGKRTCEGKGKEECKRAEGGRRGAREKGGRAEQGTRAEAREEGGGTEHGYEATRRRGGERGRRNRASADTDTVSDSLSEARGRDGVEVDAGLPRSLRELLPVTGQPGRDQRGKQLEKTSTREFGSGVLLVGVSDCALR
eukprot:566964-Rhodomonas_salina.1